MGWTRPVNVSPPERVGRGYAGFLSAGFGAVLLAGQGSLVLAGALVLLILAGGYLVLTGVSGRCPLYRRLGHVPASLKIWGS